MRHPLAFCLAAATLALPLAGQAAASFAADPAHDVAVFADSDVAVRFAHQTTVPVMIYLGEADTVGKHEPLFRPGARHSLEIYEDRSLADLQRKRGKGPIVVLEAFKGPMPKDPLEGAFRRTHATRTLPAAFGPFCDEAGIAPESRGQIKRFVRLRAQVHSDAFAAPPVEQIYAWSTPKHWYILGKLGPHPETLQVQLKLNGLAGIKANLDLTSPRYHYVHW